jgi:hypothetical protein
MQAPRSLPPCPCGPVPPALLSPQAGSRSSPLLPFGPAMNTKRTNWPAERPDTQPLTLKVTIPAKAVPLFKALVEVTRARSPEDFAAWALCKGMTSDEAMTRFDDLVNDLL